MPAADDLLSTTEACALLGVERSTLVRWAQAGRIKATKLPGATGAYVFRRADVDEAVAAAANPAGNGAVA